MACGSTLFTVTPKDTHRSPCVCLSTTCIPRSDSLTAQEDGDWSPHPKQHLEQLTDAKLFTSLGVADQ